MPTCYILSGLPGSGKTTLAKALSENGVTVSADNYFIRSFDGRYVFDRTKLKEAHDQCFSNFIGVIEATIDVIVDNTNLSKREYTQYTEYAVSKGYKVIIVRVHTDLTDEELAKRNVHGVPVETIKRMRQRMDAM